jgi:hypothetical protein
MESFPFEEYEITLEKEGVDPSELGISPILLKTLGSFGTENHFNFTYVEIENAFSISFYQEDIAEVAETAGRIKKLDSIAQELQVGLKERELGKKLEQLKQSKKFIKSLKIPNLLFVPMSDVLEDILNLHGTALTNDVVLAVQKLNVQKLENLSLEYSQRKAVESFLNFQLNYAKILLGIVIAAKIH